MMSSFRKQSIVAIGLATLACSTACGDDLVELIKDAQATSRAGTVRGRCDVKIVFYKVTTPLPARISPAQGKILALDEPTQINASICWDGDSCRIKYDARGPGQVILGYHPVSDGERDEIIVNNKYAMTYRENSPTLNIHNRAGWSQTYLLNLNPTLFWNSCCPPSAGEGRSWIEMLEHQPPAETGLTVRYETVPGENSTIVRTRFDSNGGRMVMVFAMDQAANIVKVTYDNGPMHDEINYRWKRLGERTFVPETIEVIKSNQGKILDKFNYEFSNVALDAKATQADFTLEGFLAENADKRLNVHDHRTNKRYVVGGFGGIDQKILDGLIKKATSSGFSAPVK